MKKINSIAIACLACLGTANAEVGDLTGTATLELNSHFISYGTDVWSGGGSATNGSTVNPSVSLNYQAGENTVINAGFWLDVNDNRGVSYESRETDVWIGVSHTIDKFTGSVTFQNWQYAGNSEEILDIAVSYDTFLSPTLKFHQRLGNSNIAVEPGANAGRDSGSVLDLGLSHSFALTEKTSLGLSANFGYALTEFNAGEDGYAYTSVGAQYNYNFTDATTMYVGLKHYFTDDEVVGPNGDDEFLTYTVGISYSF